MNKKGLASVNDLGILLGELFKNGWASVNDLGI